MLQYATLRSINLWSDNFSRETLCKYFISEFPFSTSLLSRLRTWQGRKGNQIVENIILHLDCHCAQTSTPLRPCFLFKSSFPTAWAHSFAYEAHYQSFLELFSSNVDANVHLQIWMTSPQEKFKSGAESFRSDKSMILHLLILHSLGLQKFWDKFFIGFRRHWLFGTKVFVWSWMRVNTTNIAMGFRMKTDFGTNKSYKRRVFDRLSRFWWNILKALVFCLKFNFSSGKFIAVFNWTTFTGYFLKFQA